MVHNDRKKHLEFKEGSVGGLYVVQLIKKGPERDERCRPVEHVMMEKTRFTYKEAAACAFLMGATRRYVTTPKGVKVGTDHPDLVDNKLVWPAKGKFDRVQIIKRGQPVGRVNGCSGA